MLKFRAFFLFVACFLFPGCTPSEPESKSHPMVLSLDDPKYHQINKPLTFDYYDSQGILVQK